MLHPTLAAVSVLQLDATSAEPSRLHVTSEGNFHADDELEICSTRSCVVSYDFNSTARQCRAHYKLMQELGASFYTNPTQRSSATASSCSCIAARL